MIRAKSPARCVLTSDSAALAGMAPGEYTTQVGGRATVAADGRLELTGTGLLAGSGRSLRACLEWARDHLPFAWGQLLRMATTTPAAVLRQPERVTAECDVVVREGDRIVSTVVDGVEVFGG